MNPDLLRLLGAVAVAVAVALAIWHLVPPVLSNPMRDDYAAANFQRTMRKGWFSFAWPAIRLTAYYVNRVFKGELWRHGLRELLRRAGRPAGLDPAEFLAACILAALAGVAFGVILDAVAEVGYVLPLLGLVAGIIPWIWLDDQAESRKAAINRGLPQALDLIVLCMSAGKGLQVSVKNVLEHWSDKSHPLYEELEILQHELEDIGTGDQVAALLRLCERTDAEDVHMFVAQAVQAVQGGSPIEETLRVQASVARTKRFQRAEKAAGEAAVKVLIPQMFIFAATMLLLMGGPIVKYVMEGGF